MLYIKKAATNLHLPSVVLLLYIFTVQPFSKFNHSINKYIFVRKRPVREAKEKQGTRSSWVLMGQKGVTTVYIAYRFPANKSSQCAVVQSEGTKKLPCFKKNHTAILKFNQEY
jgi:hypothetical protein